MCAIQTLQSLARLGPVARETIPDIFRNLKHMESTWELRRAAAIALGPIAFVAKTGPDAKVIDGLTEALNDSSSQVRAAAGQTIMALGPPADGLSSLDRSVYRAALKETEPPVRIGMYTTLVSLNGASAGYGVTHLVERLKDKDSAIRDQAMQSIALLGAFFGPPRNNAEARDRLDKAVLDNAKKESDAKQQTALAHLSGQCQNPVNPGRRQAADRPPGR